MRLIQVHKIIFSYLKAFKMLKKTDECCSGVADTFSLPLQVQVLFRDKWALNKLEHHPGH